MKHLLLSLALLCPSCLIEPLPPKTTKAPVAPRFTVTQSESLYVVTDSVTGRQWFGIYGVGFIPVEQAPTVGTITRPVAPAAEAIPLPWGNIESVPAAK